METISLAHAIHQAVFSARCAGQSIGFVPTMGALHEGHLSLVRRARAENDLCVASVFVNPTQFAPGEDFEAYPRDLSADQAQLAAEGVDVLFAPPPEELYPPGPALQVDLPELGSILEGQTRPNFFGGVALVVTKLLNLVQPTRLYLGQKDFQQTVVVRQLIRQLLLPVELVVCPTTREADGLAMSSRNAYLSAEERRQAPALYEALMEVHEHRDEWNVRIAEQHVRHRLASFPAIELDYFSIRAADDLRPLANIRPKEQPVALIAAWVGSTRLIDNLPLATFPPTL